MHASMQHRDEADSNTLPYSHPNTTPCPFPSPSITYPSSSSFHPSKHPLAPFSLSPFPLSQPPSFLPYPPFILDSGRGILHKQRAHFNRPRQRRRRTQSRGCVGGEGGLDPGRPPPGRSREDTRSHSHSQPFQIHAHTRNGSNAHSKLQVPHKLGEFQFTLKLEPPLPKSHSHLQPFYVTLEQATPTKVTLATPHNTHM